MTVLTLKNKYKVDVSTKTAGSKLIGFPCIVYEITVISDAAGDATVSFADSASSYSLSNRVAKAKTTDENQTVQLVYPRGKKFSSGVYATSNLSSVDVAITYQ